MMKTNDGGVSFKKTFCLLSMCVLGCFACLSVNAQEALPNAIPRTTTAKVPLFSDAELDQMLAPVALYPDVLLTQTLIASTYPSEAIEAGNWLKANPNLRGKEAVEAASQTDWDDSIKSLAAFPEILVPMAEYPDWTTGLGNAFLSQQQQLMNRVQYLRQKAKEQGNLQTNGQVKVQTTEQQTIVIEPATTQVVYVPYYNPAVVYGPWWWPAYTPVYWNPWPYAGYATGYSTGFMWSGAGLWFSYTSYHPVYDWQARRVYIVDRDSRRPGPHRNPLPKREWSHRPEHRHDISYQEKAYKPGSNTPIPGQHGKPVQRPKGTPDGNHAPGQNDRTAADKNRRPGSHMSLTDENGNKNRPASEKRKPFDIPGRSNNLANNDRPANGHGNPVSSGMSGIRPVINPSEKGPSANRPAGNRSDELNGPAKQVPINRPESNPAAGNPSNAKPGHGLSSNQPGNSRPMLIPPVNRPANNRPVSVPSTNSRPQNPAINSPSGNRLTPESSAHRPAIKRETPNSSVNRPMTRHQAPGQSAGSPTVNRPVPSVSRGATSHPSDGGGKQASSTPSRPAPSHQGRLSGSDTGNHDRSHGS